MCGMKVRRYQPGDGDFVSAIFFAAARRTGRQAYSERQVQAWAPAPYDAAEYDELAADGRILLVAVDAQDRPVAWADLETNGHIDHIFCHPESGRRGAGTALYERIEQLARELKLQRLYVEASEIAKPFFERQGFRVIDRRDFEIGGVPIHNYAMDKTLY